jgi:hypothetical protein
MGRSWQRLGWFVLFWALGVTALALVGLLIRHLIH